MNFGKSFFINFHPGTYSSSTYELRLLHHVFCFRMPDLRQRPLRRSTTDFIIGTSRTKYIKPSNVVAAVHSYRGANLLDLCSLIERYPVRKLDTVILIVGYNDYRDPPKSFVCNWNYLIQLDHWKFQPNQLILKTISNYKDSSISKKIRHLNFALFKLLESIKLPIISLNLNRDFDPSIFCHDGIHFSFQGNAILVIF